MAKGNISVNAENIFPIIKKFLYSDHEIFLRELISNATDATLKLKHLVSLGEINTELGELQIEIKIDADKGTLHIMDRGIGMTGDEVEKYINQVAFSGAEEFLSKYEDKVEDSGIIGHFGLGFYSAFMVAKKVEIVTKSWQEDAPAVRWECDGSPEYTIDKAEKETRGTEIILHIDDDSKEFLEESRVTELLNKYNRFMPISIKFGTKEETQTIGEGDDAKEEKYTVDNIINNPEPAWTKKPADLSDVDYKSFYRELYPMQFDEPMFHIHLNVDYPFNLTGVLYFPKLKNSMEIQKDKIQLYQNQVFVTEDVQGIVPEFLTLLRGVIDSPDIPLNVSRSYLQTDGNVKKISNYITKKVGDKLKSLFNKDRESFEQKWNEVKPIIEYGSVTEEKFYEKADAFTLYPDTDGKYYTWAELEIETKEKQTDKNEQWVILYTSDPEGQFDYVKRAKDKDYTVLVLDSPLASHYIQKLETAKEKVRFTRVDADSIDKLIDKDEKQEAKLDEKQKEKLKELIEAELPKDKYSVQIEDLNEGDIPFSITMPEFMRRMQEMQAAGGGGMFGQMPEMYTLITNANHPLAKQLLDSPEASKDKLTHALDLAKLSQNLLRGEALNTFVQRSLKMMES